MSRAMRWAAAVARLGLAAGPGFVAGLQWHKARIHGWDDAGLTVEYLRAHLEGEAGRQSPVFSFELANHLDRDYAIRQPSDVQRCARLGGALSCDARLDRLLQIDLPVVVPSGDKALLFVHFRYDSELDQPDARDAAAVAAILAKPERLWNHFDSLVLLDERYHLRVTLPLELARKGTVK